jgi:hypothetical protein
MLTTNINMESKLSGNGWRPIGTTDANLQWTNSFDGGNYIISNFWSKSSTGNTEIGLFGRAYGSGNLPTTFKNLTIETDKVNGVAGGIASTSGGILMGWTQGIAAAHIVIDNVHVKGIIRPLFTQTSAALWVMPTITRTFPTARRTSRLTPPV